MNMELLKERKQSSVKAFCTLALLRTTLFPERHCARLREDVEVFTDCFEIDGCKFGTHCVANFAHCALAINEVDDLVSDVLVVWHPNNRNPSRVRASFRHHPKAVRSEWSFNCRTADGNTVVGCR